MRSTTVDELALLHTNERSEGCKVEIIRGGVAVDVTGRVSECTVSVSATNRVATCSVTFEDVFPAYDSTNSISPLVSTSSLNSPTPLLWPGNEIKIYVGVEDLGTTVESGDLRLLFHGILGDSIMPSGSRGNRKVTIQCRDQAKALQDRVIKGEYIYGSEDGTAVVAVIQAILNDSFTWDESSSDYKKLHVKPALDADNNIDGCPFVVYPVKVGSPNANSSVWDAINQIVGCTAGDDIGYELRYTFLPSGDTSTKDCEGNTITVSSDGFYLTLLEIDQSTASTDDSIDASTDVIEEHTIDIYDDTIRNDLWGVYYDRITGEFMEIHRSDEESIASYGLRTMVIGQEDVPFIDTFNEMWNLLGVGLNKLKDVPASDRFSTQLMYHIEPNDLIDTTNACLATGSASVAILDIHHTITTGGGAGRSKSFKTSFTGIRDRVTGGGVSYSGNSGYQVSILPSTITAVGAISSYRDDPEEPYTETTLQITALPDFQVEYYQWRWAIKGSGEWNVTTTTEPFLVLPQLPPNVKIAWTVRAKVAGGYR